MIIEEDDDLAGFEKRSFAAEGLTFEIWRSAALGTPVILLHELPSITPEVMRLARVIAAAGFQVHLPSFMGRPGRRPGFFDQASALSQACVRQAFAALGGRDRTRPAARWVRALADDLSDAEEGRVGVIGLCLTGGFALAAAVSSRVAAAFACEPALPVGRDDGVDLDPADQKQVRARLESDELAAMVYRFQGDSLSPCSKLDRFGAVLGTELKSRCLPDAAADPAYPSRYPHHSVMTNHLVEAPGSLTQGARDELIAVLNWRLRDGPRPASWIDAADCLRLGCARKGMAAGDSVRAK